MFALYIGLFICTNELENISSESTSNHVILQESQLKAARVQIYVRRGGPNYQKGLAKMRALGQEIGLSIEVFEDHNFFHLQWHVLHILISLVK